MVPAAPSLVLDVTRTLSAKSIETPTGIDRVERAYIRHFLASDMDVMFLCRLGRGIHLMDGALMGAVLDQIHSGDPSALEIVRSKSARVWRTAGRFLVPQIARPSSKLRLPPQFTYLNVGHTNLDGFWLKALRRKGAVKIIGLVHDMIPLDYPEFQAPASIKRFQERMRALAAQADLIITNSSYTQARVSDWFVRWGKNPVALVNPLGLDPPIAVPAHSFKRPAFVVLGTIEPRKNHGLLLDVWESFGDIPQAQRPQLHLIGRRGWLSEKLFKRLDTSPMMGRDVFEHGSLCDADVSAYLRGAHALLFPSLVEGYGLPILEAHCVGTPTIASDIEAFREFEGAVSLYLKPFDARVWRKAIIEKSNQGKDQATLEVDEQYLVPSWESHFALVEAHL